MLRGPRTDGAANGREDSVSSLNSQTTGQLSTSHHRRIHNDEMVFKHTVFRDIELTSAFISSFKKDTGVREH
jgi:hypothetical protein